MKWGWGVSSRLLCRFEQRSGGERESGGAEGQGGSEKIRNLQSAIRNPQRRSEGAGLSFGEGSGGAEVQVSPSERGEMKKSAIRNLQFAIHSGGARESRGAEEIRF